MSLLTKTIRYLDAPNRVIAVDVYDSADTLVSAYIMQELAIGGVYRLDIPITDSDMWCMIKDSAGNRLQVERLAPSLEALTVDVAFIRAIEGGKWQIVGQQMVFYAEDNVTEVARFNFKDDAGLLTNPETAFGRDRV